MLSESERVTTDVDWINANRFEELDVDEIRHAREMRVRLFFLW